MTTAEPRRAKAINVAAEAPAFLPRIAASDVLESTGHFRVLASLASSPSHHHGRSHAQDSVSHLDRGDDASWHRGAGLCRGRWFAPFRLGLRLNREIAVRQNAKATMSGRRVPTAWAQLSVLLLSGIGLGCGGRGLKSGNMDSGLAQVSLQDAAVSMSPESSDASAFSGSEPGDAFASADVASDSPDLANPTCGNGQLDPGEECDDGNLTAGDGCSPNCQVECKFGSSCPRPPRRTIVCGDGVIGPGEVCDDANTNSGDGCSGDCTTQEFGYLCFAGAPCTPICGDRMVKGSETCDDGNSLDGDGCSSTCLTEPGFDCSGAVCISLASADGGAEAGLSVPTCGDGIISGAEECDNGPLNAEEYGDCSTHCLVIGCGDGVVNGPEECDLGPGNGTEYGDPHGCTATCTRPPFCGDGIVDHAYGECCDDGDSNGLDGLCAPNCKNTISCSQWL